MTLLQDVRRYMVQRDRVADAWKLRNSPLALPGQTPPPSVNDFVKIMDDATRRVMETLTDGETWSPVEWEAFLELIPNIRKLLNMSGEGGF